MLKPLTPLPFFHGWSLLELLLVIALIAAAAFMSLPRSQQWQSQQQLWQVQQQLLDYLSQARQAALFGQRQLINQTQLAALVGEQWQIISNRRWPLSFSANSGRASATSLSLIPQSTGVPVARLIISQYGRMRWCLASASVC